MSLTTTTSSTSFPSMSSDHSYIEMSGTGAAIIKSFPVADHTGDHLTRSSSHTKYSSLNDVSDMLLKMPSPIVEAMVQDEMTRADFNNPKSVSSLRSKCVFSVIFFTVSVLVLAVYILWIYFHAVKVVPPEYTSTNNFSVYVPADWENTIQAGFAVSVIIDNVVMLDSVSVVTNCGPYIYQPSEEYFVYYYTANLTVGCTMNITLNYTMKPEYQGQFALASYSGFEQVKKEGDQVLKTSGFVFNGHIYNFVAETIIAQISGLKGGNVYISTDVNNFIGYEVNTLQLFLFMISAIGTISIVSSRIMAFIYRCRFGMRTIGTIYLKDSSVYIEV